MKHRSVWLDTATPPNYPQLPPDKKVDVAIVGGGLAGLHTAYLLKQQGKKVAVIEANQIGSGVSGHTTAHITSEHNLMYDYLVSTFGSEKAKIYADANQQAIAKFAEIIAKEEIECDFQRVSQLLITEKKDDIDKLKKEFEVAQELSLPVTYKEETDLPFNVYGAIEYHHQATFHPAKYIVELGKRIHGDGSFIFEKTRVMKVEEGEPCRVITEGETLTATDVVIATHFPILDRGGYFARMKSARSYVMGVYIEETVPVMYDDTADPYHYVRTQKTNKGDLVIIGGEDHETGAISSTEECYQKLEEYIRSHFKVKSVEYRWSSQDNYPHDRVPFIGKYTPVSQHLFVTTGFNGEGMTQSMISGLLLADQIQGKENTWSELYSPQRFNVTVEGPALVNVGVLTVKDEVSSAIDKVIPANQAKEIENLQAGESKVIKIDTDKIAVYKDSHNILHAVSANCGHQGCEVVFNQAEKSWDCPCHGSRFTIKGDILHGPTVRKLPAVNV